MKEFYIFILFVLLSITNLAAQATFDWENATNNGNTIEQTVNSITATFTVSSGVPFLADGNGYGGTSGYLVGSAMNNTDISATLNFSSPINIQSLFAVNAYFVNPGAEWTFTPTGGSNSDVIAIIPNSNSNGITVTLNWTEITQITITSASGMEGFAFDNIISVIELNTQDLNKSNSQIKLFPNPSEAFINISGLTKVENYAIYDVLGRKINAGNISDKDKIDIQNLTNGLYFLKFENGDILNFIKK
jgi:hypothetical protein